MRRESDQFIDSPSTNNTPAQQAPFVNWDGNHQQIDISDNNRVTKSETPLGPLSSIRDASSGAITGACAPATGHIISTPSLTPASVSENRSNSSNSNSSSGSGGGGGGGGGSGSTYANTSGNTKGAPNRRVKFKSLLETTSPVINNSDAIPAGATRTSSVSQPLDRSRPAGGSNSELIDLTSFGESRSAYCDTKSKTSNKKFGTKTARAAKQASFHNETITEEDSSKLNSDDSDQQERENFFDDHDHDHGLEDDHSNSSAEDDQLNYLENEHARGSNNLNISPSHHKLKTRNTILARLSRRLRYIGTELTSKITSVSIGGSTIAYTAYEESTTTASSSGQVAFEATSTSIGRKYKRLSKHHRNPEQNFRGPYRYSRIGIVMTIFKKLLSFLVQRSTLALFGAFLIHVTLGTIYTLSNINSYLTSYMRKHGSPNATYGGSMWISSSYAVGQGISMVLGGLIERRFSARVSCFIGCALHSLSIMSTSKAIDYGQMAILLTYGFLPGFGCGLAYMTPMSNGFGWFPNRKGLVAGVILAGFGIGTFVFNMAQTAYVNPDNLSPPKGGYFTQDTILNNVPHLFTFLGTIYASMQFIGCCLLFKPPSPYDQGARDSAIADERPILAGELPEMSFRKAIRSREFIVLFLVFGITNQGVLFVNSMLKEYGQQFIADDLYLAWTGSMASIANSLGRLGWGMAIDRYSFTQCFTSITTIFGTLLFLMPFEFILSSKLLYLLCTLGIFGSFSGWMSTYPVHLSRIFGLSNSGMIYGLIFVSQVSRNALSHSHFSQPFSARPPPFSLSLSPQDHDNRCRHFANKLNFIHIVNIQHAKPIQALGGILTAFAAHYLIDQYSRFVPFFFVTFLEILGLAIYHLFYENK